MVHQTYLYAHTHWDREWYLPFRKYQYRLVKVIQRILSAIELGTIPNFTLDGQTVLLEDYFELYPEEEVRFQKLTSQGKLDIGPWYVMPDEFLVSGESLIRNLSRGINHSKNLGVSSWTGYLPDTFGHSQDVPMILKHCGINTAVVWRGVNPSTSEFLWESPSKDIVKTYHLNQGYFQGLYLCIYLRIYFLM